MMRIVRTHKLRYLLFVARFGHYKNRIILSENLKTLKTPLRNRIALELLNDRVQRISENGINSLLLSHDEFNRKAAQFKKEYWEAYNQAEEENATRVEQLLKGSSNYKRKFGDINSSFEMVKELLKKPIHGGRWF
ncbi:hypothetical protein ACJD0Z_17785 [Flavobacteriaceae bacterium M23B6Z8]